MSTLSKPTAVRPPENRHEPDWELGWRYETVTAPTGTTETIRVPLTYDEALHPEEGYVMPMTHLETHRALREEIAARQAEAAARQAAEERVTALEAELAELRHRLEK